MASLAALAALAVVGGLAGFVLMAGIGAPLWLTCLAMFAIGLGWQRVSDALARGL